MGMLPRWLKADSAYAQTQRTVDRQFLFKPDPAIRNIIGAVAARAQRTHPIIIHWLEFNINHAQNGVAAISNAPEHLNNLVLFKKTFHRILAEEINRLWEREGAVFSTPPRTVECVDEPSLEQQFFYALTNPVKDGLVAHSSGDIMTVPLSQPEYRNTRIRFFSRRVPPPKNTNFDRRPHRSQ